MLDDGTWGVSIKDDYKQSAEKIVIPSSYNGRTVTKINDKGFASTSYLQKISIPSTVTSIGNSAFMYCENLQDIIIPANVSISPYCFFGCHNLSTVVVQEGSMPITIGDYAFAGDCISLSNIYLPNNLSTIGHYAFYGATSLTNITIPTNVTTIYQQAFVKSGLIEVCIQKKEGWQYISNGTTSSNNISNAVMSNPKQAASLLLNGAERTFISK